jgi:hypothetical protein
MLTAVKFWVQFRESIGAEIKARKATEPKSIILKRNVDDTASRNIYGSRLTGRQGKTREDQETKENKSHILGPHKFTPLHFSLFTHYTPRINTSGATHEYSRHQR